MHSSRMRAVHSSAIMGGGSLHDRDPTGQRPSGQRPSGQRPHWTETPPVDRMTDITLPQTSFAGLKDRAIA